LSNRRLLLGIAVVLSGAGALALAAAPASAVIYIDGDWVVNGVESYTGETIIVNSTAPNNGNLVINSLGELTLESCRLVLPFNHTFDQGGILYVRNTTLDGPNWFFFIHGPSFFENSVIRNATHRSSGGFSGTYISDSDVHFDNVTFSRSAPRSSAYRTSIIHVRAVMDFQNVFLDEGSELWYELSTITGTAEMDISNITFVGDTSMGYRTTALSFASSSHTGQVLFNIHDINVTNPNDGFDIRASSASTVYNVYNVTMQGMASTAIEVGDEGDSRFNGDLRIENYTVVTTGGGFGGTRALRAYCPSGATTTITVTDLYVTGNGRGVWVDGCTAVVTDSTMANGGYHFYADDNSRIIVYRTADNPFLTATGSNARVEHMAFLNIVSVSWQGGVAFQGDLLLLRNVTGAGNIDIDPTNWTPRYSVWWGRYSGVGLFDNRDLRPSVTDGTRSFPCSPSQFYFTESMSALGITCNDNWGPTLSVNFPRTNGVVNRSSFVANGSVVDLGSGLGSVGWSFDNVTWNAITVPSSGLNWTAPVTDIADGRYFMYFRAIDRVGQAFYVTVGQFLVDTMPPVFTLPVPPEYVSGSNYTLEGLAEPQARMSYRSITGLTGQATVGSTGEFTLVLPLTEGLNVFTITAVDLAGNLVTQTFSLVVDHTPPALAVFLEATTYTPSQTLFVEGLAEANSTVVVNGVTAPRTGEGFEYGVLLAPGPNNILVSATDGAGNVREWMGLAVYDNAPPDLSVVVSTGNTTSAGVHVTGKATVPVAGQVTDALTAVAWLSVNGIEYTFDGDGVYFLAVNVSEGVNTFTVMAADLVGNTARFDFSVLRDSTPPTATVTFASEGAPIVVLNDVPHTREATVTIVVTMSEAGSVILNGLTHSAAAGENAFYVTLAEGQNDFRFIFRDAAGNVGTSQTHAVVRDTTPPAVALTRPTSGQVIVGDSFAVEGTADGGSTVFVDDVEVPLSASGAFAKTLALPNGTTTVTVRALDALGNEASVVVSVTRGEEALPPPPPQQDFTMSLLFLAVGIGAGVGLGFMVRARGASAMRKELADAESGGPAPPQAAGPALPPKGPRGPQPPGPY